MFDNIKITVIIPAYNIESYIGECLDSIVGQTYRKLEIIVVDDGSTDNTSSIVDSYATKDDRIKVIHKINGGLSSARNAGLDVATGDYISFIDGDDFVDIDLYESIVKVIDRNPLVEIVQFGYNVFDKVSSNAKLHDGSLRELNYDLLDGTTALNRYVFADTVSGTAWSKVFKKTLIDDIRFFEGKFYEDGPFVLELMFICKIYIRLNLSFYYYRRNREGAITESFSYKLFDEYDILDFLKTKYKEDNNKIKLIKNYEIEHLMHCFTDVAKSTTTTNKKELLKEISKNAKSLRMTSLVCPFGIKWIRYKIFVWCPKLFAVLNYVMNKLK